MLFILLSLKFILHICHYIVRSCDYPRFQQLHLLTLIFWLLFVFKYCNSSSLTFNYLTTFSYALQEDNYRLLSLHSALYCLGFVTLFFRLIRSTYLLVFMFLSMPLFVLLICVYISYKIPYKS